MLTREEIAEAMKDRNLARVSDTIGVPYHRLRRLVNEMGHDPRYSDIKAVSNYLIAQGVAECPHCLDRGDAA